MPKAVTAPDRGSQSTRAATRNSSSIPTRKWGSSPRRENRA